VEHIILDSGIKKTL